MNRLYILSTHAICATQNIRSREQVRSVQRGEAARHVIMPVMGSTLKFVGLNSETTAIPAYARLNPDSKQSYC